MSAGRPIMTEIGAAHCLVSDFDGWPEIDLSIGLDGPREHVRMVMSNHRAVCLDMKAEVVDELVVTLLKYKAMLQPMPASSAGSETPMR